MGDDGSKSEPASPASFSRSTDAPWLEAAMSTVRPGRSVVSVESTEAGGRRSTLIVRFADADPVVVRGGRNEESGRSVATEGMLLAAITDATAVPVPEPLSWGSATNGSVETRDESQRRGDGAWIVTRFVEGDDLHGRFSGLTPATRRGIAAAFGRYLGELHATFQFDGYGRLTASDGILRSEGGPDDGRRGSDADAWCEWLVERGHESLDRLPAEFDDIAEAARTRLDAWSVETAPTPRLYPWDLRPGNALVADGRIAAIVDWESPLAAGAALSVAKAEYLLADWYVPAEVDALRRAFRDGYAAVRALPAVETVHRIVAVAETAVDSHGRVTNPRYPPVDRSEAVQFHRKHLRDAAGISK